MKQKSKHVIKISKKSPRFGLSSSRLSQTARNSEDLSPAKLFEKQFNVLSENVFQLHKCPAAKQFESFFQYFEILKSNYPKFLSEYQKLAKRKKLGIRDDHPISSSIGNFSQSLTNLITSFTIINREKSSILQKQIRSLFSSVVENYDAYGKVCDTIHQARSIFQKYENQIRKTLKQVNSYLRNDISNYTEDLITQITETLKTLPRQVEGNLVPSLHSQRLLLTQGNTFITQFHQSCVDLISLLLSLFPFSDYLSDLAQNIEAIRTVYNEIIRDIDASYPLNESSVFCSPSQAPDNCDSQSYNSIEDNTLIHESKNLSPDLSTTTDRSLNLTSPTIQKSNNFEKSGKYHLSETNNDALILNSPDDSPIEAFEKQMLRLFGTEMLHLTDDHGENLEIISKVILSSFSKMKFNLHEYETKLKATETIEKTFEDRIPINNAYKDEVIKEYELKKLQNERELLDSLRKLCKTDLTEINESYSQQIKTLAFAIETENINRDQMLEKYENEIDQAKSILVNYSQKFLALDFDPNSSLSDITKEVVSSFQKIQKSEETQDCDQQKEYFANLIHIADNSKVSDLIEEYTIEQLKKRVEMVLSKQKDSISQMESTLSQNQQSNNQVQSKLSEDLEQARHALYLFCSPSYQIQTLQNMQHTSKPDDLEKIFHQNPETNDTNTNNNTNSNNNTNTNTSSNANTNNDKKHDIYFDDEEESIPLSELVKNANDRAQEISSFRNFTVSFLAQLLHALKLQQVRFKEATENDIKDVMVAILDSAPIQKQLGTFRPSSQKKAKNETIPHLSRLSNTQNSKIARSSSAFSGNLINNSTNNLANSNVNLKLSLNPPNESNAQFENDIHQYLIEICTILNSNENLRSYQISHFTFEKLQERIRDMAKERRSTIQLLRGLIADIRIRLSFDSALSKEDAIRESLESTMKSIFNEIEYLIGQNGSNLAHSIKDAVQYVHEKDLLQLSKQKLQPYEIIIAELAKISQSTEDVEPLIKALQNLLNEVDDSNRSYLPTSPRFNTFIELIQSLKGISSRFSQYQMHPTIYSLATNYSDLIQQMAIGLAACSLSAEGSAFEEKHEALMKEVSEKNEEIIKLNKEKNELEKQKKSVEEQFRMFIKAESKIYEKRKVQMKKVQNQEIETLITYYNQPRDELPL